MLSQVQRSPQTKLSSGLLTAFLSSLLLAVSLFAFSASALAEEAAPDGAAAEAAVEQQEAVAQKSNAMDAAVGYFNQQVTKVLFFNVTGDLFQVDKFDENNQPVLSENGSAVQRTVSVPFIVAVLMCGGIFYFFRYAFINFRGFVHSIQIVSGRYDSDDQEGDISSFRALTSALSATIGLGNIAGVAIAIQLGGPGAVFWMVAAAIFAMCHKFNSCTLAQLYRRKTKSKEVLGGPMYYLELGLRELGEKKKRVSLKYAGKALGVLYACMVILGSFGGGNMFQANQCFSSIASVSGLSADAAPYFGVFLAISVGLVIIGGIKRIGYATSRIVPLMVMIYVGGSLFVLASKLLELPSALALIVKMAFSGDALQGGVVGVMITGVQRASFSNEGGIGSSAIAHSAAKTDEPVREGLVAMIEPFVDTIIVCVMTAMVIIVTGVWNDPSAPANAGVQLTNMAFASVMPWFPVVLAGCVVLFAYSTMISWSYYGERGWIYLLDHFNGAGQRTLVIYRVIFCCFVFIGAVSQLGTVLDFSDLMILCMAFPNILGGVLLSGVVARHLKNYWARYKAGEFEPENHTVAE